VQKLLVYEPQNLLYRPMQRSAISARANLPGLATGNARSTFWLYHSTAARVAIELIFSVVDSGVALESLRMSCQYRLRKVWV